MTGKSGSGQACAACKYQRRKCSADCPLAPYFPPEQPNVFLNAHKLFGVSNILRILRQVGESQKKDAMKSIIYEANAREKDPVHGCFGIILMLQSRLDSLRHQLDLVRTHTMLLHHLYHNAPPPPHCSYDPHALLYTQQQQQLHDCYDSSLSKLLQYDHRQLYTDSTEAYESSAESSLKESQSMDHVGEHELKSAAALFTLTNQQ